MKNPNITKNRMPVALLFVLAASIIGLAPAFSTSARAGSGSFSINDVSGIYVDLAEGFSYGQGGANPNHYVPDTFVGLITFTPATGTFHADGIVRAFGTNIAVVFDGNYTVDANGHGTMTWLSSGGNAKQRDFYIVNGGAELKWMNTDPPATAAFV